MKPFGDTATVPNPRKRTRYITESTKGKWIVVVICGRSLLSCAFSADASKGKVFVNDVFFVSFCTNLIFSGATSVSREWCSCTQIVPFYTDWHAYIVIKVIFYVIISCCIYSASLPMTLLLSWGFCAGRRRRGSCEPPQSRDEWNHKVLYLAPGQDWRVKQLLFLSDLFHVWILLVLVCVTASFLSVALPSLQKVWVGALCRSSILKSPTLWLQRKKSGLLSVFLSLLHAECCYIFAQKLRHKSTQHPQRSSQEHEPEPVMSASPSLEPGVIWMLSPFCLLSKQRKRMYPWNYQERSEKRENSFWTHDHSRITDSITWETFGESLWI